MPSSFLGFAGSSCCPAALHVYVEQEVSMWRRAAKPAPAIVAGQLTSQLQKCQAVARTATPEMEAASAGQHAASGGSSSNDDDAAISDC